MSDDTEEDDPLGDIAADIEDRRDDPTEDGFEELFDEMEVEDFDAEEVWAQLENGAQPDGHTETAESDVRVQHKHVCHGCEYFSTPSEMHCNHEGTEIREVVDIDHYEVVDCPVMVSGDFE